MAVFNSVHTLHGDAWMLICGHTTLYRTCGEHTGATATLLVA